MIWNVLHLLAGKLTQYWCYVTGITGEMSLDTFFNRCRNTPWNGRKHSLQRNYQRKKPNKNRTLARYSSALSLDTTSKKWSFLFATKNVAIFYWMNRCHPNWFRITRDDVSRGSSCATRNEVEKLRWMLMFPGKNELARVNVTGYRYLRNIVNQNS